MDRPLTRILRSTKFLRIRIRINGVKNKKKTTDSKSFEDSRGALRYSEVMTIKEARVGKEKSKVSSS